MERLHGYDTPVSKYTRLQLEHIPWISWYAYTFLELQIVIS